MSGAVIRDLVPADLEDVRRIHETSGLDYSFPDILSPLFLVKKVLSIDGQVRVAIGGYLTSEAYLWADRSDWADPDQRWAAIQAVANAAIAEAKEKGLEEVVIWLPPGMDRFGERLEIDLGFSKYRSSWKSYSKRL